jgi:GNAT superfamily N-acetyltransferase
MDHVRKAVSTDVPAIRDVVRRAYEHYIARIGQPPAPMLDDYDDLVRDGLVSVLETPDGIAGVLVLVPHPDHLLLDNVAVDPRFQGRGFGRRLVAEAEAEALRLGLPEVRLYTDQMMTENAIFYGHLGFAEAHCGEQPVYQRVFVWKPVPPAEIGTGL